MQHSYSDPKPWYIVPVEPGADANLRRWNFVIITILALLVLGVFLPVLTSQTRGTVHHQGPAKIRASQLLAAAPSFDT